MPGPQARGIWRKPGGLKILVLEGNQVVWAQCPRETKVLRLNSDVVDMRAPKEWGMEGVYQGLGKGGGIAFLGDLLIMAEPLVGHLDTGKRK